MKLNIKNKDEPFDKTQGKEIPKKEEKKSEKKEVAPSKVEKEVLPELKKEKPAKEEKRKEGEYTAKDIYVLKGLEPVRKRPGMYIGSTGLDGLHHLIWEVVDNGLDEAVAGYATDIEVRLLKDGKRIRVVDNGRGIPVETHPQTKKSALETVMCTLHAGGKFGGKS